eukprot:scaffold4431_cov69-Skeletonema_dohrnii-CCMP3373.AAC.5
MANNLTDIILVTAVVLMANNLTDIILVTAVVLMANNLASSRRLRTFSWRIVSWAPELFGYEGNSGTDVLGLLGY